MTVGKILIFGNFFKNYVHLPTLQERSPLCQDMAGFQRSPTQKADITLSTLNLEGPVIKEGRSLSTETIKDWEYENNC